MQTQSRREPHNGLTAAFLLPKSFRISNTMQLNRALPLAGALLLAASLAALLLRFPPEQYTFYPACPIYRYLHLECPGCGATRALAALLHGHLRDAIHDNALFILGVLPTATTYLLIAMMRSARRAAHIWPTPPKPAIYASLAIALTFAVARNLIR